MLYIKLNTHGWVGPLPKCGAALGSSLPGPLDFRNAHTLGHYKAVFAGSFIGLLPMKEMIFTGFKVHTWATRSKTMKFTCK